MPPTQETESVTSIVLLLGLAVATFVVLTARRGRPREVGGSSPSGDPPPAEADDAPTQPDPAPPGRFGLGQAYTRVEIHAALGGGVQDYLPHVDGVVVCGCFNPGLNPDAPGVVLPGFGPGIERWAEVFGAQRHAVPCFLKRATNVWEYVGDFRVRELSRDAAEVARWAASAGREGDVSMVLHLEEARREPRDTA